MDKYICRESAYIYDPDFGDPENGVAPGTAFENLPKDWVCPICGATQDEFEKLSEEEVEKFKKDGFGKFI